MTLDYFYGQSGELFSYFRIPKALFQDSRFRQLSTDARTLYGILLDRMSLSVKNGWLDEQGRVYIIYTGREVQESLCCAEHKAVKLFPGIGAARPHRAQTSWAGQTKPDLRQGFFLRLAQSASTELPKQQFWCCRKHNSGTAKTASK